MDTASLILQLATAYTARVLPRDYARFDDVVSDSVFAMLRKLPQHDPGRSPLTKFVAWHTQRIVSDYVRIHCRLRHAHPHPGALPPGLGAIDRELQRVDDADEIDAALARLKPQAAEDVRRYYLNGETLAEVGASRGVGPAAVHKSIAHAVQVSQAAPPRTAPARRRGVQLRPVAAAASASDPR